MKGQVKAVRVINLCAILVVLDLATKHLASSFISPVDSIEVLPVLKLVNIKNTGAAFGMLSVLGNRFFIGLVMAASLFLVYLIWKGKDGWVGLTLILSGAVGNLADRVFLGYVRDFLYFHAGEHYWPAFNIADSAITVGVGIMLLGILFHKEHHA